MEENVEDPAIEERMDIDPQPSTSGVQIHASGSDNDSDHEGIERESENERERIDDSAFIERNVLVRQRPLRRRMREMAAFSRHLPRRRSGERDGWQETDFFIVFTFLSLSLSLPS